jgi:two-component system, cell cycle sensor histidine kinase and response regulator CckA
MTENFDTGRVRTILVVDDEPMVLGLVEAILREEGYEVVSATSVEQAIETATSLAGRIALAIVNSSISGVPGRNVVDAVERVQPGIKVLRFSGHSEDHLRATGEMKVENSFLQKPFTTQALQKKVRDLLGPPSGSV